MAGEMANNKVKANGCIYVDMQGRASFIKNKVGKSTFSKVSTDATVNLGSDSNIPTAGQLGDQADRVAETATKEAKKKAGLGQILESDLNHTKDFFSNVSGIMSGKNAEAAQALGKEVDTLDDLKTAGSKYLDGMGGGSKAFGAAKVGGYMLGTAMLVDMLNPFSD